jgi:hypothetical protein
MNLIIRIESTSRKYNYILGDVIRPTLLIANGLNINREGKVTVHISSPTGKNTYIWYNKNVSINRNDVKEIPIFSDGLRVTEDYPSGIYYLTAEIKEGDIISYDSFPFFIESRRIFPFKNEFFKIEGTPNKINILAYGHKHTFSNVKGDAPSVSSFAEQIKMLKKYGVNMIKIELLDLPDECCSYSKTIYPWDKIKGKWDLNSRSERYYIRLKKFIKVCSDEEVFLVLNLIDYLNLYKSHIWPHFPINPEKNIQKSFEFPARGNAIPHWYNIRNYKCLWDAYSNFVKSVAKLSNSPYLIYNLMDNEPELEEVDLIVYHISLRNTIQEINPNAVIASKMLKLLDIPEIFDNKFGKCSFPNSKNFINDIKLFSNN